MLDVDGLAAGYGEARVLEGVSFRVREGEMTCILGPNGSGKTTLLRAVIGLLPSDAGAIRFRGEEIRGRATHTIVRRGMTMIPEGRRERAAAGPRLSRPSRPSANVSAHGGAAPMPWSSHPANIVGEQRDAIASPQLARGSARAAGVKRHFRNPGVRWRVCPNRSMSTTSIPLPTITPTVSHLAMSSAARQQLAHPCTTYSINSPSCQPGPSTSRSSRSGAGDRRSARAT